MNTELIAQLDAEIKAKQELRDIALAVEAGAEWEVALPLGVWMKPFQDIEYYVNNDSWKVRLKPKPVTRPWSKPEDVPGPVCWIRARNWRDVYWMVVGIDGTGIAVSQDTKKEWGELWNYEYSTDRIKWLPCTTEEAK